VDLLLKELLPQVKDSRRLSRIHLETLIPMLWIPISSFRTAIYQSSSKGRTLKLERETIRAASRISHTKSSWSVVVLEKTRDDGNRPSG
jgi:hypothetical protein